MNSIYYPKFIKENYNKINFYYSVIFNEDDYKLLNIHNYLTLYCNYFNIKEPYCGKNIKLFKENIIKIKENKYKYRLYEEVLFDFRIKDYNYKNVYIIINKNKIYEQLENNIWVFNEFKTLEKAILNLFYYENQLIIETNNDTPEFDIYLSYFCLDFMGSNRCLLYDKRFITQKNRTIYITNFKNLCYNYFYSE